MLSQDRNATLLAVSGGIDSMVMAELFFRAGRKFGIAHLNHGLRGTQADEDEKFVAAWAQERGIPYFSRKLNLAKIAEEKKLNLMEAAREERYAFFREIINLHDYQDLATAHHKDDNIETVIFHALRGSGVRGLRGIPEKRESIIRPLLHFGRNQIEEFAHQINLSWREDPSNANEKYKRNEIRHSIIPNLEKNHPGIKSIIHQKSKEIEAEFEQILPMMQAWIDKNRKDENSGFSLSKSKLIQMPHLEILFTEIFRALGLEAGRVSELIKLLESSNSAILQTNSHEFINDRESLIVRPILASGAEEFEIQDIHDVEHLPISLKFSVVSRSSIQFTGDESLAYLDLSKLTWPLLLRRPKTGDRFRPLGMKGSQLLSDFFIQKKMSLPEKESVWLLCSGDDIVWILNHRIHNDYRLRPETEQALSIQLI